ncbi:ABC transporter substrate-binding protein [Alicyclobacillus ferrooxydans]|uniref:ABC transporter substrate-binding protein n=1 Tax=Alicyclobacillus ferrooxydans TaxID=471514 RepID=A0A0P9CPI0_9BACL|nr:ABC transporter substrate-binding protein [Alicyclobacillus ferrooxydans]KPV44745.1 ABC transporter substrate-binding protein [Alicyclobacillus ferrooxydans]
MQNKMAKRGTIAVSALMMLALAGCGAATSNSGSNTTGTNTGATGTSTSSNSASGNSTSGSGTSSAPITVRYSEVIRSVFYAPAYVAMQEGFFKQEGLNVQMVTSEGSNTGAAALLSGSADVALVGPETSVYIYNQHGSQTLKVFDQLTNTDGSFILSKKKINNFTWQDLQGQSIISWRPGSSPQMVLNYDLKQKGVNANVITNIGPAAMVGAFESGKANFIQVYEPVASQLIQSGQAYYAASVGKAIGSYPETAFEATSSYIQGHPQVIQDWTNAIYKATQWIDSHSANQVAAAIAPYFSGTSNSLLASSIQRYQALNAWKTPILSPSAFATLQKVLIMNGTEKASQKVNYSAVIDPSFAQNITK